MDYEETMVEEMDDTSVDLPEEIIEEEEPVEEEPIDTVLDEEEPEEAPAEEPVRQANEPGYVQRRIDRALARERDSIKAEIQAELEAQYAPIKERLLEMDAQELVRKGIVKDLDTAKELVRYRQGQPKVEPPPQPRNAQGQFIPREDPATTAKIDMLAYQAEKIKAQTGLDVIEVFSNNPEIKNKIVNGEMDFYDLAEQLNKPKKKPPTPMRHSNGANSVTPNAFETMSDEQFERLERQIDRGVRYTLR